MYVLSEQQVSFILNDIRRNGIELEELQLNLLDHICCIIETEMPPDANFDEFYRSIIPRFFKRELREIQEETNLLLTFKHYYAMKKVMIASGAFSAFGFILGSFFKIMHWPGASALLLLAVVSISFVFLPIMFILKVKEVNATRDKAILAIGTVFGILISLSALFKVMHWPGANVMWLIALGILFFLFLPIYFFSGIRNPDNKVNTIVSSVLILVAGGILFMLTNLRNSIFYENVAYAANQSVQKAYDFSSEQNMLRYENVANDSIAAADMINLKKECNDLCKKIEDIKQELFIVANGDEKPQLTQELLIKNNLGNYDIPTNFLFDRNHQPKSHLVALKQDIENLKKLLESKYNRKNLSVLSTADVLADCGQPEKCKFTWENAAFFHAPFEMVIRDLTQLQLNIRIAEAGSIK